MRWLLVAMLCAVFAVPPAVAVASPSPRHHRRRRSHHRRHTYQAHPSHARYKQIQQALADKGFLPQDDVDGFWGPKSIDAMKRFQAAQKLPADGDIDALTLIALGLGPKHKSSIPVTTASTSTKNSSSSDTEADAQPQQN
jgi:peptidoglycan hydrolase-like protein with peptidoglycan-binding domain